MKPLLKYTIYGLLIALTCFFLVRSCAITDRYSKLLGEYTTIKGIATENARIAEERIESALATIDNLTSDNEKLNLHISESVGDITQLDNNISTLENQLDELRGNEQTISNLGEQVVNLEGQVNIWKDKFTLSTKIIADKDAIIFNLNQQYRLQLGVSAEYKELYESQRDVVGKCNTLLNMSHRKLRTAKFGGTIKTIAIGAIGGYVAYTMIKGK